MNTINPTKRNAVRGFTLVELLIVVSVMGLLLALTVPAFVDIGRGSRMAGAVTQLHQTLQLARQWAITQREDISIIFPDDYSQVYSGLGTNHYEKALRSYVVYSPSRGYLTEWRYLPEGIYFVDSQNTRNAFVNNANRGEVQANNNLFNSGWIEYFVPFPTADSSRKPPIYTLTYQPDGTVNGQGIQPVEIYMAEGILMENRGSETMDVVWKGNPVLHMIKIRPFTGIPQVVDFTQI